MRTTTQPVLARPACLSHPNPFCSRAGAGSQARQAQLGRESLDHPNAPTSAATGTDDFYPFI